MNKESEGQTQEVAKGKMIKKKRSQKKKTTEEDQNSKLCIQNKCRDRQDRKFEEVDCDVEREVVNKAAEERCHRHCF